MTETPKKKNRSISTSRIVLIFLVTLVIAGIASFFIFSALIPEPQQASIIEVNDAGVREIKPPFDVQDFAFPAQTGEEVSLSSLRGKYVLLYFGYTHCPDICLASLADIVNVHETLGDSIHYVFVSVDRERDTPEVMANYLNPRNAGFVIGMTGSEPTLTRAGVDYGLFYKLNTEEGEYYTVDHSASMYLITPDGKLEAIFGFGTEPDVIVDYIQGQL
ncbi:MAG: SCO family protein [Anaerolineae bacterium]|nr:SCO family protein [Anaerolineae bacterium]